MILIPLTATTSLTTLTSVFEAIIGWVISFLGLISSEPLLLVGLAIVVAGLIAGLAFRMVRGKGRGRA